MVKEGFVAAAIMGAVLMTLALVGCGGSRPQSPPQPTREQVQSNADRSFEKLKQEERERSEAAGEPLSR